MLAKDCRARPGAGPRSRTGRYHAADANPNGRAIRRRGIRRIYNLEVTTSEVTFDLVAWTLEEQQEWIDAHSGAHPAVVAVGEPSDGPRAWPGACSGSGRSPLPPPSRVRHDCRELRLRGPGPARPRGRPPAPRGLVRRATEHGFHAIIAASWARTSLDRAAPLVRFRACRRRARGGPQAPQVARRGRAPATALRRSGSGEALGPRRRRRHPVPAIEVPPLGARPARAGEETTRRNTRPGHQQRSAWMRPDRSTLPPEGR